MDEYVVLLYYKYTEIADPKALMERQRELCQRLGMKGRILISIEGINGTAEGLKKDVEKYIEETRKEPGFADIHFKRSVGNGKNFPKLKVKVRPEVVTTGIPLSELDPRRVTGKRLAPDELHQWIADNKDIAIVDMRNDFEFESGHFDGSIFSGMKHFRDLKDVPNNISDLKDKTVVTVCTGGIRCEKASGYLVNKGFKDVYQLDGGIVTYMEKYPTGAFKGALYVFDDRNTMHFVDKDKREVVGKCRLCANPCEDYVNCAFTECNEHFISCESCREQKRGKYCDSVCQHKQESKKLVSLT